MGVVYLDSVKNRAVSKVSLEAWKDISCKTYSHLLSLDNDFHYNPSNKTRIFTLYKAHGYIERNIKQTLAFFLPVILDCSISLTYLSICCGWQFSLAFLTTIGAYSAFTFRTSENRKPAITRQKELDAAADSKMRDALANISTVKYFSGESQEVAKYQSLLSENVKFSNENIATLGKLNLGQRAIFNAGLTASLLLAISKVKTGDMTVGDVIFLQSLLVGIMAPLNFLGMFSREFSESLVEISGLMELRNIQSNVREKPDAKEFKLLEPKSEENTEISENDEKFGEIEFQKVNFGYSDQEDILKYFNLKIESGSFVSVIGPSGIGKSTLFSLLFRFADPKSGSIRIHGEDISDIKLNSLRGEIAIVSQQTFLFNDTILYNLQYANPKASFEEIVEVCKKVRLHNLISDLPQGYNSPIGEGGASLSGGEKQRVGLARALLKKSSILLLDEATSALDSANEKNILSILNTLKGQKTIIAITHRLNINQFVDKVCILDENFAITSGSHQDLLNSEEKYREMFNSFLQKKHTQQV